MNRDEILKTNKHYRDTYADLWFGTAALPEYGVHFVTEDELHLFGDVSGKKMLEILLCNRKISAYVNALAKAGFAIEQIAEQTGRGGSARGGIQSPKIPKSPLALKGGMSAAKRLTGGIHRLMRFIGETNKSRLKSAFSGFYNRLIKCCGKGEKYA